MISKILQTLASNFKIFFQLLEQFFLTVKCQNIFWWQNAFLTCSWRFLISTRLEQLPIHNWNWTKKTLGFTWLSSLHPFSFADRQYCNVCNACLAFHNYWNNLWRNIPYIFNCISPTSVKSEDLVSLKKYVLHCKPIPVMRTVFSLCSISNREKPVFITWEPCINKIEGTVTLKLTMINRL